MFGFPNSACTLEFIKNKEVKYDSAEEVKHAMTNKFVFLFGGEFTDDINRQAPTLA